MRPSPTKIFLSDNRKVRQSDVCQSLSTFSSGDEKNTHANASSGLYVLDDEELAGNASIAIKIEKASYMILLPLTGNLIFTSPEGEKIRIRIGELKVLSLTAGSSVWLTNPFTQDTINYLRICISADQRLNPNISALFSFNLNRKQNELIDFYTLFSPFSISIGRFKSRQEGVYYKRDQQSRLFTFVIDGAFEFENRLLLTRDGMEVSGIDEVHFEPLSEGSVVLLIERFVI
ncbi:hypothetical protein [Pedobacter sp. L105]|uniref:pirin family protein n=1 Tax=Pedobacter sp. L105 TaxID=1641871 RepID=UPI00131E80D7|nr:hypothetical protein [Pedobacter sp. L105]